MEVPKLLDGAKILPKNPGPIWTIVQNFTLIGVTVAKISVTKHIPTITVDLVSNKSRTGAAFVVRKLKTRKRPQFLDKSSLIINRQDMV